MKSKGTISLPQNHALSVETILDRGWEIVGDFTSDFGFCWKKPQVLVPLERSILFQSEPPVAKDRLALYPLHDKFKAVFCFAPFLPNEYPLTSNFAYPYRPAYELAEKLAIWRGRPLPPWAQEGSMPSPEPRTGAGVYFAGRCSGSMPDGLYFGGYRQYNFREDAAEMLVARIGGTCVGEGFGKTTKCKDWRLEKFKDISNMHPDYVLCIENCEMTNYASEKFTDGLLSGRLALYYGAPNINGLIPQHSQTSFVDLRQFVSEVSNFPVLQIEKLACFLENMTDMEYDLRVNNQYELAYSLCGEYERRSAEITNKAIDILEDKL